MNVEGSNQCDQKLFLGDPELPSVQLIHSKIMNKMLEKEVQNQTGILSHNPRPCPYS